MWTLVIALGATGCVDYGVSRRAYSDAWFQQDRPDGVDIVWVQDDSGSMSEERDMLADAAEVFITHLDLVELDYRLGVVSTDLDPEYPGRLVGPVLEPGTPNLLDDFLNQVLGHETGNPTEQGLAAAIAAAAPGGVNVDFGRVDADLEIIVFSDEDDHSDTPITQVLSELEDPRNQASLGLSAIVGDPPQGCISPTGAADHGERYIAVQEATQGLRESICSPDFEGLLSRVALRALGLEVRFFLSAVPDLSTLAIYVDEVLVHERPQHGWRYDVGDNSIVFDGLAVPPPGSQVYASYLEWFGVVEDLADTASP